MLLNLALRFGLVFFGPFSFAAALLWELGADVCLSCVCLFCACLFLFLSSSSWCRGFVGLVISALDFFPFLLGAHVTRYILRRCILIVDFNSTFVSSCKLQSNLNSSNIDGSFTMANSNSFLSPYEILPLAQENKYLGKLSYFIMKLYVVCAHYNRHIEAILITLNIQSLSRKSKIFYKIIAVCLLTWLHDYPSVARTTHVSNNFLWSQRCSSH